MAPDVSLMAKVELTKRLLRPVEYAAYPGVDAMDG